MRLPHGADLPLPSYQSAFAAGLDLIAAVPADAPLTLAPGARALVPTGIAIALPQGHEAQVRPRSGLAVRHGLTVLNSPGTIDADYRGEIQVLLINLGGEAVAITRGMRRSPRSTKRRVERAASAPPEVDIYNSSLMARRMPDCSLLPLKLVATGANHAAGVPQGHSCHCRRDRCGDQRPQAAGLRQGAGGAP